jgi:hypothetical protein
MTGHWFPSVMNQTHRKDAKDAKSLCVFIKELLCMPCVFAVKNEVYGLTQTIGMMPATPACQKSFS